MKKIVLLLAAVMAAQALAVVPRASYTPAGDGILNVSEASAEQVRLCSGVLIDSFESSEAERTPDEGTAAEIYAVSSFEAEKSLRLSGNGSAGVALAPSRRRTTENTRSLAVCVYAEPVEGAILTLHMSLRGSKKEFSAAATLPQGVWCAAYLPTPGDSVRIDDIHISVTSDRTARVEVLLDWVHTSIVDGLPDRLRYFASDFSATRGTLVTSDDGLVFTPDGYNPYIESTYCGYMTGGRYNCLTVELDNKTDASKLTLSLKLDSEHTYSDENIHSLPLTEGEGVYRFPIGGFRSGTTVEQLKLGLSGSPDGRLIIKRIYFDTYRFPAVYKGSAEVAVTDDSVTVTGKLSDYPSGSKKICIYRLAPGEDEEEPGGIDSEPYAEVPASGSFTFTLPRTDNGEDNALFKYLVLYEGKSTTYTACVASAFPAALRGVTLPYKGTELPEEISSLSGLYPGAVYIDVAADRIFADSGETYFTYGGGKRYFSDEELSRLDSAVERCAAEGAKVVLRLLYAPFSTEEELYFTSGGDALPDITNYRGASHLYGLVSFMTERYAGRLAAVVPFLRPDSDKISALLGFSFDRAEKYAADLLRLCAYAAERNGAGVMTEIGAEDAGEFLRMLRRDIPDGYITVSAECDNESKAAAFIRTANENNCRAVVIGRAETPEELIALYHGSAGAAAVCAKRPVSALFSLIDTDAGADAARELAPGVIDKYEIKAPAVRYSYQGELAAADPPEWVTKVFDGATSDGWTLYDGCKNIFNDTLNSEPAAALSFDLTGGVPGSAVLDCRDAAVSGERVYVRLYADYLPENTDSVSVTLTARCELGRAEGVFTLPKERSSGTSLMIDPGLGRLKELVISPALSSGTLRISVYGVYTAGPGSEETLPEQETETLPEPGTERFDTAPVTEEEKIPEGSGLRLYITAISVILGMFALCGVVIFVLKKTDDIKNKKDSDTGGEG